MKRGRSADNERYAGQLAENMCADLSASALDRCSRYVNNCFSVGPASANCLKCGRVPPRPSMQLRSARVALLPRGALRHTDGLQTSNMIPKMLPTTCRLKVNGTHPPPNVVHGQAGGHEDTDFDSGTTPPIWGEVDEHAEGPHHQPTERVSQQPRPSESRRHVEDAKEVAEADSFRGCAHEARPARAALLTQQVVCAARAQEAATNTPPARAMPTTDAEAAPSRGVRAPTRQAYAPTGGSARHRPAPKPRLLAQPRLVALYISTATAR